MNIRITHSIDLRIPLLAIVLFIGMVLWQCEQSPTTPDSSLKNLLVTEIHYNPLDTGTVPGDSLEFIELKNIGNAALDVGTMEITDGVKYTFPNDAEIPAGGYYVIASNKKYFHLLYGFYPDGVYSGTLKNRTETITFTDAFTVNDIITITYADSGAWPDEADGDGYSLVLKDQDSKTDDYNADKWRRSVAINGSPGEEDVLAPFDSSLYDLRITEIHYHPADPDTFGGDSLEFIELKNIGNENVRLDGVGFTDGISYQFEAGTVLEPGKFIVLGSNETEFRSRYDFSPFDVYDGQLSNSGEKIVLEYMPAGIEICIVKYEDGNPWPKEADGDGYSLVPYDNNPSRDQNSAIYWRRSFRVNGSPGSDDPGVVLINEILPNPDASSRETIELYNPGNNSVDIGGWMLTDDIDAPVKFIIPAATIIDPHEYLQFTEDDFSNSATAVSPFSLSNHGEDVYLMSDSAGCGTGYCHGFSYGEIEEGYSIGRYVTSHGNELFTVQRAVSLGDENDGPLVGPIIISEIMFHSDDGRSDYVEITNIGLKEIRLYDQEHSENTWKIDNIDFTFPEAVAIKSGESVIIASDTVSENDFREKYSIDEDIQVFQFSGTLPDDEIKIALLKPEEPYIKDISESTTPTVPYMAFDKISYDTKSPWPTDASGNGNSIHRVDDTSFSNDPQSWKAAAPSPGEF